ncbi:MAG: hypothetical protein HY716_02020 [Planctomycetes bacterium]|nr:hypothetical protein [Planctomycetota bacterium]
MLERGAFSDDKVVEATKGLMPILVDCDWGRKNKDISGKYGVRGYPTVVFTDPEGGEVARMTARDAESLAKQISEMAAKHSRSVPWVESLEAALETAKKESKPLAIFFCDGKKDAEETEASLAADPVRSLHEKLVFIKHEITKDCETCKAYRITWGSNLIIVDPSTEDIAKALISKITGGKSPKALKSALDAALKKWDKKTEGKK